MIGFMNKHAIAADILQTLDLGSSIAEQDTLLEKARVETSAFTDLLRDKVAYWIPYVYRKGLELTQGSV
jgi:hypothetical protein